jgi:hypothetical protein
MPILAGVFNDEVTLNDVLGALYEHGVYESDVFLMRGSTAQVAMPALPNVAMAEGVLEDLRITDSERAKFAKRAEEGKVVCFVFVEDDQTRAAMNVMQMAEEVVDLSADDYLEGY